MATSAGTVGGKAKLVQQKLSFFKPKPASENDAPQQQSSISGSSSSDRPLRPPQSTPLATEPADGQQESVPPAEPPPPTAARSPAEPSSDVAPVAHEGEGDEPPNDGLSAYERERLANIERNEQVLRDLGLLDSQPLVPPPRAPVPKRTRTAAPAAAAPPPPARRRRSSRVAGAGQPNYASERIDSFGDEADSTLYAGRATDAKGGSVKAWDDDKSDDEADESDSDEQEGFDNSSVYRYLCAGGSSASASASASSSSSSTTTTSSSTTTTSSSSSTSAAAVPSASAMPAGGGAPRSPAALHGWQPSGCFTRTAAHVSYGVDALLGSATPLLASAGAKGLISVYRADALATAHALTPLVQWNAHSGKWIGEVQFCSVQAGKEAKLLSCSNDAT